LPQPEADGIGVGALEFPLGDDLLGFGLGLVQLADVPQHQVGAGRIALLGLEEVAPAVNPTPQFDDVTVGKQVIESRKEKSPSSSGVADLNSEDGRSALTDGAFFRVPTGAAKGEEVAGA
jgi:hypothetical protein